jgi:hypothetical protein
MVHGLVNDFSENGLFIKCNQDFPIGTVIDIEIFMPDNNNSLLRGIVRRKIEMPESHRKSGLGIELIEKDTVYRRFLKSFNVQAKQPLQTPSRTLDKQVVY